MIADENAVNKIPKNFTPCAKNHFCTHGTAACTYSCTE